MRVSHSFATLLLVGLIAASLVACGGGKPQDKAGGTPPPPEGAWDRLILRAESAEVVDRETALTAFSLAVRPLPGAPQAEGSKQPIMSGSSALGWAFDHYASMSAEQKQVVAVALSSPTRPKAGTPFQSNSLVSLVDPRAPIRVPPDQGSVGCYLEELIGGDSIGAAPYRAIVDEMVPAIGGRLGRSLRVPTYVIVHSEAELEPQAAMYTHAQAENCATGQPLRCNFHVNPLGATLAGDQRRAAVAHEVMHCFVYDLLGGYPSGLPGWLAEGIPAYVGESMVGGTPFSQNWWHYYLTTPSAPITTKSYSAIGLYAHMAETGTDPWKVFDRMLQARQTGAAWEAGLGASADSFLESWGSGLLRDPSLGAGWDTTGPGITPDKAARPESRVGHGSAFTVTAPATANLVAQLTIQSEVVLFEVREGTPKGRARFSDGAQRGIDALASGSPYCGRAGNCACPEGSRGEGTRFTNIGRGPGVVAFSGGLQAAGLGVTGMSLEDFCGKPTPTPTPTPTPGSASLACMSGKWRSEAWSIPAPTPALVQTGGDGIELTVNVTSGTTARVTANFDRMKALVSPESGDSHIEAFSRGTQESTITLDGDQITVSDRKLQGVVSTIQGFVKTRLLSSGNPPAGPNVYVLVGPTQVSCAQGRMETKTDSGLGQTVAIGWRR